MCVPVYVYVFVCVRWNQRQGQEPAVKHVLRVCVWPSTCGRCGVAGPRLGHPNPLPPPALTLHPPSPALPGPPRPSVLSLPPPPPTPPLYLRPAR